MNVTPMTDQNVCWEKGLYTGDKETEPGGKVCDLPNCLPSFVYEIFGSDRKV